jgi:predicted dienelactone hydrolase
LRVTELWLPKGVAPAAGYPLIVFSHGFSGCNTQSIFLMNALASAGYLVLAPNHQDARCGSVVRHGMVRWSDQTHRDRAADMEAVLDAMLREKTFRNVPINAQRIGQAGHSLGGYTVLGLAGGRPVWRCRRSVLR